MKKCKFCGSKDIFMIYNVKDMPVFQNKVFHSYADAVSQPEVNISLLKCNRCGFVFNGEFESERMKYDENYQNEQAFSQIFKEHLNNVADYLERKGFKEKKILEIGCGKGTFIDLLEKKGFRSIVGYDPAYEGERKNIFKSYYSENSAETGSPDLIIMRHFLEHIEYPKSFLEMLRKMSSDHTRVLIEVPDFEWIVNNNAFWDICFEHASYFDHNFLSSLFCLSETKRFFKDQYIVVLGNVRSLKNPVNNKNTTLFDVKGKIKKIFEYCKSEKMSVIWGGSTKGVVLLNLIDKKREMFKYVVDINDKKQGKFIPLTGHKIVNPEVLFNEVSEEKVLIVNDNYYEEITSRYKSKKNIKFYSLERIVNE